MKDEKIILITGGTGSWGNELTAQLLIQNPKEIRIYSRNEFAQVTMQRKFNDSRLKFIIGDVRDYEQLNIACKNVDTVYHLAALKHIPICEEFPVEAIKTNITGTENVIKVALNNNVDTVVDVSTDKAANPLNLYGMTKAVGEKLILHANTLGKTKFVCVRGGNVLGSNGSVVQFFIDRIQKFNDVPVTRYEMTRYFLTLHEAIKLVLTARYFIHFGGGLFVMKMPSCKIIDLAKVLVKKYGNKDTKIREVGLRPGEKLHEVLVTEYESPACYVYDKNYYLIYRQPIELQKVDFTQYSSDNQKLMSEEEILVLLNKGGF
jgi:FlaA1/EpsC-like NDP-sugar epimerase